MDEPASRQSGCIVLYGATGQTGSRIAARAVERGLAIVLAGRDRARLEALAARLGGVPIRVASLADAAALARAFDGASVVLNAAGPFEDTAPLVLGATLAAGAHYLDVSGEARAVERAGRHARAARERGRMIMPAVGFDVLASDCLAVHVARRLPRTVQLSLGIFGLDGFSRGSGRSMARQAGAPVLVRHNGVLEARAPGELRRTFMVDGVARPTIAVTWADVVTAWISTGVPSIATYFGETPALQLATAVSRGLYATGLGGTAARALDPLLRDFGSGAEMPAHEPKTILVAEARAANGEVVSTRLDAPGPYAFTALSAVAVLERVLAGDVEPGFETPARVYGADFVLRVAGVTRQDLA
jgi:short subunit dehydrogenase-like uncharacterized protein